MQKAVQYMSPLAEKRILFFHLRKCMIGRRAYSDSIRSKKVISDPNRREASQDGYSTYKEALIASQLDTDGNNDTPTFQDNTSR